MTHSTIFSVKPVLLSSLHFIQSQNEKNSNNSNLIEDKMGEIVRFFFFFIKILQPKKNIYPNVTVQKVFIKMLQPYRSRWVAFWVSLCSACKNCYGPLKKKVVYQVAWSQKPRSDGPFSHAFYLKFWQERGGMGFKGIL